MRRTGPDIGGRNPILFPVRGIVLRLAQRLADRSETRLDDMVIGSVRGAIPLPRQSPMG